MYSNNFFSFMTEMIRVVTEVLKLDMSINIYMFHGGTNFGFMNGALAVGLPAPKPMVTSYGEHEESIFFFLIICKQF